MRKGFMALVARLRTCGLQMQLGTLLSGGKHLRVNVLVCKGLFGVWESRHGKTPCMGFWRVFPGVYTSLETGDNAPMSDVHAACSPTPQRALSHLYAAQTPCYPLHLPEAQG